MAQELTTALSEKKSSEVSTISLQQLKDAYAAISAKTVTDVLVRENRAENAIGYLARTHGNDIVRSVMVIAISDMLGFFNLTQGTMNEQQVVQTILLIQEDYGYLTLADFKVFFSKIKKGHYGQVYNRMDGQMILGWLSEYADERAETAATQGEVDAYSQKERDNRVYTPEMVQRLFGDHRFQKPRPDFKSDLPPFNEKTEQFYAEILSNQKR